MEMQISYDDLRKRYEFLSFSNDEEIERFMGVVKSVADGFDVTVFEILKCVQVTLAGGMAHA